MLVCNAECWLEMLLKDGSVEEETEVFIRKWESPDRHCGGMNRDSIESRAQLTWSVRWDGIATVVPKQLRTTAGVCGKLVLKERGAAEVQ